MAISRELFDTTAKPCRLEKCLGNFVIGFRTVDYRPCVCMHGLVVLLYGFQHPPRPPLPLDARCIARLLCEDHRELSAPDRPKERPLIPPAVPLQLGHLEGLEVDPASVQREEACVFVGQDRPLRAFDDPFESG